MLMGVREFLSLPESELPAKRDKSFTLGAQLNDRRDGPNLNPLGGAAGTQLMLDLLH